MNTFKVGNAVQVMPGTVYLNNNKEVPETLFNTKLYVRDVKGDNCTIARVKTGPVLGDVHYENLIAIDGGIKKIDSYVVQIPVANLPVYHSANKNSGIVKRLNRFSMITIIDEKNGFGKIKIGAGWIDLSKVIKL